MTGPAGRRTLAVACATATAAAAGERRALCADRVALRASPAGFVIGHLYAPQQLIALGRTHRWTLVRKRRLRGWVPTRVLCEP